MFLLPRLFVTLWRGCFGFASGHSESGLHAWGGTGCPPGRIPASQGCSPLVPEERSRSGDSTWAAHSPAKPRAKRWRLRKPAGRGSISKGLGRVQQWLLQAPRGTTGMKTSSWAKQGTAARLLARCFLLQLCCWQPKSRPHNWPWTQAAVLAVAGERLLAAGSMDTLIHISSQLCDNKRRDGVEPLLPLPCEEGVQSAGVAPASIAVQKVQVLPRAAYSLPQGICADKPFEGLLWTPGISSTHRTEVPVHFGISLWM